MLLGLMRLRGVMSSMSLRLIRSCTVRRSFKKPFRISSRRQLVDRPQAAVAQVVDVVDVRRRLRRSTSSHQILDRVDQVLRPQDHFVFGHGETQLAIDAEAADATQPIAVRVVELFVEQGLGLFQLRRIARPQPLINPQQRFFVARRAVVRQRVEQQRRRRRRP